jgi:acyl-CoA synthetase (AMP-forming)/AMP-acid ligase II
VAVVLAVVSAFFVPPDGAYLGYIDYRTLAILFSLMTVMAGLRQQGVFDRMGRALLALTGGALQLVLVLVGLCFFCSMLITNDVAELRPDGCFRILGRRDNTINTGGIKVQAEALEEELRPIIPVPYAITSVPDPKFGEAIVLLVEFTPLEPIRHYIAHHLEAYKRPKRILQVEQIPKTETGKVRRAGCRELALKNI